MQVIGGLFIPVAAELPRRGKRAAQGLNREKLHRYDGRQDLGVCRQFTADGGVEVTRLPGIAKQKTEQLAVEQQRLGVAGFITGRQQLAAVLGGRAQQRIQRVKHAGLFMLGQIAQGGDVAQLDLVLHQRGTSLGAVGEGLEPVRVLVINRDGHPAQLVKPLPERGVHVLHSLAK